MLHDPMMTGDRYGAAPDFEAYLATVEKNREFWHGVWARSAIPADLEARAAAVQGRWHLLALSEDWCGDAVNLLPLVARLAASMPDAELRVLGRDANLDLMDAHLTLGGRSIPVVILYDGSFVERGCWGPRPAPIQSWVRAEGLLLPSPERYRHIRTWYARDRGRTTLTELVELLERAGGVPGPLEMEGSGGKEAGGVR